MNTRGYEKVGALHGPFRYNVSLRWKRLVTGLLLKSGRSARRENRLPLRCRPAGNVGILRPLQEYREELGIELSFRRQHDLGGAGMGKSSAIGARRSQRVIYVSDAQDPRRERYVFAREPVGIPFSIPALVMIPNDCPDVSGKIDVGDKLESRLRMSLHDCPLFLGELARLVQHFGWYDDLSDVVEKGSNPEPEERASVESGAVGQDAREKATLWQWPRV